MSETGFDELPEDTSAFLKEFAESGFINVVGGCCGTTPDHIRAIAKAVTPLPPRKVPTIPPAMRLSGLEPFTIDDSSLFVNVGERTNVTGSKAFARMILNEEYDNALAVARQQVENGAQIIDINMDEAVLDSVSAMHRFLNLIASRTGNLACSGDAGLVQMGSDRSRVEMPARQIDRQFHFTEKR